LDWNKLDQIYRNAANALINGSLVCFPTETVYGLGADAGNKLAVSRIFRIKERPTNHPLIVHVSTLKMSLNWVTNIPGYALELANNFWPGPLTLILERSKLAKNFITGGQNHVGIRIPNHPVALNLLKEFESRGGFGVAAPSANKFGAVSTTSASAVFDELGEDLSINDVVLDGGPCIIGIESTIVDCSGPNPRILRPGAITYEMINSVLKNICNVQTFGIENSIRSPGSLKSHYMPIAQIIISRDPIPGSGFLALDSVETPSGVTRLARPTDSDEFAQVLYASYRLADKLGLTKVFVFPPAGSGIEKAIYDRVEKSSLKQHRFTSRSFL
jgi:L-threonylcarbamoyladenylate synthase